MPPDVFCTPPGGLRVWQANGDANPGIILSGPDVEVVDETRTKPIVHVSAFVCDDTAIRPFGRPSDVTTGNARLATVSSDGEVTSWALGHGGSLVTGPGPAHRAHLETDVKSVTFHRASRQLCVLSTSGKLMYLCALAGCVWVSLLFRHAHPRFH